MTRAKALLAIGLIWRTWQTRWVLLVSATLYLLLYLFAIGDLGFHGAPSPLGVQWNRHPFTILFKQRSPFYFEAIAVVELPFLTYLFSPMNLLLGLVLSTLVGLNLAFSYLSLVQPKVCYGRPALGFLASLPALLAGAACCGPLLLLLLGIQATASLIALFGILVPIALLLLAGTLVVNVRRTDLDYP
jgi:hypothetical protein